SAVAQSQLTASSASRVQADSPALASQVAGITGTCHHNGLIFVFLVDAGFHHVGQAGLELLTSCHPLASASQSAEITGVNHRARPKVLILTATLSAFQSGRDMLPTHCSIMNIATETFTCTGQWGSRVHPFTSREDRTENQGQLHRRDKAWVGL
uniref:Uncharacterized protein n=1 Tax=Macaca fascicularis TaxID=9541 RepID=A0A7N9DHN6_MACFA